MQEKSKTKKELSVLIRVIRGEGVVLRLLAQDCCSYIEFVMEG